MKKIFVSMGVLVFLVMFMGSTLIDILTQKNNIYKEDIYKFDDGIKEDKIYEISYKFLKGSNSSDIIILDEKDNTIHKNSGCVGECKVNEVKDGYLIMFIDNEIALYFNRLN